jgi:hypothetical protein
MYKSFSGREMLKSFSSYVVDEKGLLRVGGRIAKSDLSLQEKMPLIIPGRHYIATLLVRHHHEKNQFLPDKLQFVLILRQSLPHLEVQCR